MLFLSHSMRLAGCCFLVSFALVISGCATPTREYTPPSSDHYEGAEVAGFRDIRFWGDQPPPYWEQAVLRLQRALADHPTMRERVDVLALSGGAEDGAYGAGFLSGWTERGDRPEFLMVTGISTGALIAPFAFIGPEYDAALKRLFTETSTNDIFFLTPLTALFGGSALGDTSPLRRILRQEVDDALVAAIARESRRGRTLQIGTTSLDAQRPVIWDIGRIAESGHPEAAPLIRSIMLASASIPGAFPPVLIDVLIDGKPYQEVHVDGGVTNQIFVYPRTLNVQGIEKQLAITPRKTMWLVRNTKINPEYQAVELGITGLASRSISTLIKYQARGDLLDIFNLAKRDGFDVYLTNVPADFDEPLNDLFDPLCMTKLYATGYQAGLSAAGWRKGLRTESGDR